MWGNVDDLLKLQDALRQELKRLDFQLEKAKSVETVHVIENEVFLGATFTTTDGRINTNDANKLLELLSSSNSKDEALIKLRESSMLI